MKLLTIIGARPQFIKASVVSREIEKQGIDHVIVHTGQHFDENMSDIFFNELKIPKPNYNLGINGSTHGEMTGKMIQEIEEVLLKEKPDWIILYGDTNSTLAGSIAASKLHIKIAHIEAGLRSFNMKMPEEINRILTDRVSSALFCPTDTAVKNLKNEGYDNINAKVLNVGDVMMDSSLHFATLAENKPLLTSEENYILSTIHRAENTDDPKRLESIINSLNKINSEIPVICPLHPRTQKIIKEQGLNVEFTILQPVGYLDMINLIRNSKLVMTDSGGLQKEAYFFKKFCITLRDETEWVELVDQGYNTLVGANQDKILTAYSKFSKLDIQFNTDIYGDAKASEKIINFLK